MAIVIFMAVFCLVCVISSFFAYNPLKASYGKGLRASIVMPGAQSSALDRAEKEAKGQTVAVATKIIQKHLPGWKVVVFDIDEPDFYSKYDAWDMTKSYPNSVVILSSKSVVDGLIFGPTGGRGIDCTSSDGTNFCEVRIS